MRTRAGRRLLGCVLAVAGGCAGWRATVPTSPPQLASMLVPRDAPPDSQCAVALFALFVDEHGQVAPENLHLAHLAPAAADPLELLRLQQLASQTQWNPGTDVAGRAMGTWVEIAVDCRGVRRGIASVPDARAQPGAGARALEDGLRRSRDARLEAARFLAASKSGLPGASDLFWQLDAVCTDAATFDLRRPFLFDTLRGGLPDPVRALPRFWVVRQADSDHAGTFVFLDAQPHVLAACDYVLGE